MCKGCHQPQWVTMNHGPLLKRWSGSVLSRQRSTEPEIFTFDPIPEVKRTPVANPRLRAKRRPVKVLYPAQVRKYLPAEKKDWAKRLLILFLSIVFVQLHGTTEVNEDAVHVVVTVGVVAGLAPEPSRERALEVGSRSEESFVPDGGLVPQPPNLPAAGTNGTLPAVAIPRETVACYRTMNSPIACGM
uniref:radiation-inducible immediate-early gene IEX-1-like n=1 Tax=Pristiophorus japonicus TaxID=55135 RepID=UPI00398ED343